MKNIIRNDKRQKLNRPITGVIQKDRIWEQWYDQSIFEKELPKMSQKDYLFSCIGDDRNRTIINNRGMKNITVDDFDKMILKYEKAFAAMGLKKGDVICTIALTTPEMYAIKYSATTLGLITCHLNVLDVNPDNNGKNRLYEQIKKMNPKMIFTLDILEDKISSILNDKRFDRIVKVSMPLEYSTPIYNPERAVMSLKMLKDFLSGKAIKGKMSLSDFLSLGKNVDQENLAEIYEEKMPCNIAFTSGTTGVNKAVLLSHDANNALAFQEKIANLGYEKGTRQLALVPPFLVFWDSIIVHAILCQGAENILELMLSYENIPKYMKKYKPDLGVWSQYLWSSLLTLEPKERKKAIENLKYAIIGGERCELNAAETFYNNTDIIQTTGYGASESNTTFSIIHQYCNKVGTTGLPLPFNNVKIVDDSFNDVTYGVPGKLFITGPCLMNGYYKRDDLTKKVMWIDSDGTRWYNTGDYAVLDDDGCLTVLDRYVEPIAIKSDDGKEEKVNILDIVETIKKDRNVKNCKMTSHDGKMILHLSIDDFTGLSKEDAIDSILDTIKSTLPSKYWPDVINILDELPRTPVGKVDYPTINKNGEEICKNNDFTEKLTILEEDVKKLKKIK